MDDYHCSLKSDPDSGHSSAPSNEGANTFLLILIFLVILGGLIGWLAGPSNGRYADTGPVIGAGAGAGLCMVGYLVFGIVKMIQWIRERFARQS